jgi:uncharacterized protein DUF4926
MFNELDVVVLKKPLPGASVPVGAIGTIVFVHSAGDQAYEVEFFDQNDKTIDVCTVVGDEYLAEEGSSESK